MIIYKVTNKINGKCYIGQTIKTLQYRWERHCRNSSNNKLLYKAIKKYNVENFMIEQICECQTKEILDIMETFYIIVHHSHASENGYNITWGGEGGDTFTYNPNRELIRKKYSESRKNLSEETRKKLRGKIPWNKGLTKDIDERVKKNS